MRQNFFYFYRKFEIDGNENEASSEPGSLCKKKNILPVGSFSVRCI